MRTAASICEWTPGQTHRHVTLDIKERVLKVFSNDDTIGSQFRKEYDEYLTSKK